MVLRIAAVFLLVVTHTTYGQWANCSQALVAFSKARTGPNPSKWNASGWEDDRFPHVHFPRVTNARFYGYGFYGRYYKARTSFRSGFWIKDFQRDYADV